MHVVAGQTKLFEVGQHGLRRQPGLAQIRERRRLVALRQLRAVLAEQEPVVDVLRRLGPERANERGLELRVRAVVGAADDLRDLEVGVVDRRRELIRRRAIRPQERRLPEAQRSLGIGLADLVRCFPVAHVALALSHGAFVEAQAEPLEVGQDRLGAAFDIASRIGVVDPKQEDAAVLIGVRAVGDCTQRVAEMERTGRTGCEAHANHVGRNAT